MRVYFNCEENYRYTVNKISKPGRGLFSTNLPSPCMVISNIALNYDHIMTKPCLT